MDISDRDREQRVEYGFERVWGPGRPKLYFDRASVAAGQILSGMPLDIVRSPAEADILWMRKGYGEWYGKLGAMQALNHLPLEGAMTRKAELTANLHAYGRSQSGVPFTHHDFYQPTYRLSDPAERAEFLAQLPAVDHPGNLWILKPSNLSRGIGVKILWQFDWLKQALRESPELSLTRDGRKLEYVIQRYIGNVLLLDGRKSELRIYWLIASLDPLAVLMFEEGTARLTTRAYKLDDFDNPLIHITNTYQQKKHGGVEPASVLKWDFPRLQAYLASDKSVSPAFLEQQLKPRLRDCLAYVARASYASLKHTPPSGLFFGLYGADFILDDQLTPWLTEIQKGPGLSFDDPIKQRVIPRMLQGAASIALEVLAGRRSGQPMTGLLSNRGYAWVIAPC